MDWNSTELRRGIDKWPETQATITSIDQPYNNKKYGFLSVVRYTFQDASGEYWAGKYETRTADLPDELMTGSTISIRYNPKNPDKSWTEDDYWRSGFGRFQSFDYPIAFLALIVFFLLAIAVIKLFHLRIH
jgi:hypothetical protein